MIRILEEIKLSLGLTVITEVKDRSGLRQCQTEKDRSGSGLRQCDTEKDRSMLVGRHVVPKIICNVSLA